MTSEIQGTDAPDEQPPPSEPAGPARSIGLRHPSGRTVRCDPDDVDDWVDQGYIPVPHSGGHNNPPTT